MKNSQNILLSADYHFLPCCIKVGVAHSADVLMPPKVAIDIKVRYDDWQVSRRQFIYFIDCMLPVEFSYLIFIESENVWNEG